MKLGVVIRKYRLSREVSLRELASEIGVNFQVLSRLENGKGLEAAPLVRIMVWLTSEVR